MPTGKSSPHPSSRIFLSATDRDHYKKPQSIQMQNCRDKSQEGMNLKSGRASIWEGLERNRNYIIMETK